MYYFKDYKVVCSLTHTHTRTHTYTHSCCPQYPALSLCQRPAHTHTHTHTHTHKHTLTFTHTHTGAAHNTQHFLCTSDQYGNAPGLPYSCSFDWQHPGLRFGACEGNLCDTTLQCEMCHDCLIAARLTGSIQVYGFVHM